MKEECGIYAIKNLITKKYYIGSSINIKSRWNGHRSYLRGNQAASKFQADWDKYGESAFVCGVVEYCLEEQLCDLEIRYQTLFNSRFYGYNSPYVLRRGESYIRKLCKKRDERNAKKQNKVKVKPVLKKISKPKLSTTYLDRLTQRKLKLDQIVIDRFGKLLKYKTHEAYGDEEIYQHIIQVKGEKIYVDFKTLKVINK